MHFKMQNLIAANNYGFTVLLCIACDLLISGTTTEIPATVLHYTSEATPHEDVLYTVTSLPQIGHLQLEEEQGGPINHVQPGEKHDTFTQTNVNQGD